MNLELVGKGDHSTTPKLSESAMLQERICKTLLLIKDLEGVVRVDLAALAALERAVSGEGSERSG